jgi:hypothetical protein
MANSSCSGDVIHCEVKLYGFENCCLRQFLNSAVLYSPEPVTCSYQRHSLHPCNSFKSFQFLYHKPILLYMTAQFLILVWYDWGFIMYMLIVVCDK